MSKNLKIYCFVEFLKKILLADSLCRNLAVLPGVEQHVIRGARLGSFTTKIDSGEISLKGMKAVLIHAGTNDMANTLDAGKVLSEMGALIRAIKRVCDTIHIVVSGLLPRLCDLDKSDVPVKDYNKMLCRVCRDRDVMVIRSYNAFTSGREPRGVKEWLYAPDGLHLSVRGSFILSQVFRVQFSDRNVLTRRAYLDREAASRLNREVNFGWCML